MTALAPRSPASWIDALPMVRGRLTRDADLGGLTWFRTGGPAELLFRPADPADLADFLSGLPAEIPVTVLGVGSNLLVRDGGIPGATIKLGRGFGHIAVEGATLTAGAGALDLTVAMTALDHALSGLEFLSGVPGTIGGALRMNAGAYGADIRTVLRAATAMDRTGETHALTPEDMDLGYRHCGAPDDWIFLDATLCGRPDDGDAIARRMADIRAAREEAQPQHVRTGGSTFANPDPEQAGGLKAWELIDRAGCRGLRVGGAQVSEKHCNFLINTGNATAADLEDLGETVRRRVRETSGVELHWEIRRIGNRGSQP
jgi:UDP-N-acetylmuramate dehydrogenase